MNLRGDDLTQMAVVETFRRGDFSIEKRQPAALTGIALASELRTSVAGRKWLQKSCLHRPRSCSALLPTDAHVTAPNGQQVCPGDLSAGYPARHDEEEGQHRRAAARRRAVRIASPADKAVPTEVHGTVHQAPVVEGVRRESASGITPSFFGRDVSSAWEPLARR